MSSTLYMFVEDIAPDICSFAIAFGLFTILYSYRTRANLSRPVTKKRVSGFSASSASDTDKSGYQARNRSCTYVPSHTADRRARKPSTRSESDCTSVPSTSPVGAPPQDAQQLYQSVTRFKEVLEDWGKKQKTLEDGAMSHLQDAIAELAPHDAAIVKVLLDSKALEGKGACQHRRGPAGASHARNCTSGHRDSAQQWGRWSEAARSEQEQKLKEFEDSGDSLRKNLLELASLDSSNVIMVRKINHIGLDSPKVLEAYFSKFGTIERMMVSPCIARSSSGAKRLRPAALGFIMMSTAGEAKAAIAAGEVQHVQGHNITVGAFESHPI